MRDPYRVKMREKPLGLGRDLGHKKINGSKEGWLFVCFRIVIRPNTNTVY